MHEEFTEPDLLSSGVSDLLFSELVPDSDPQSSDEEGSLPGSGAEPAAAPDESFDLGPFFGELIGTGIFSPRGGSPPWAGSVNRVASAQSWTDLRPEFGFFVVPDAETYTIRGITYTTTVTATTTSTSSGSPGGSSGGGSTAWDETYTVKLTTRTSGSGSEGGADIVDGGGSTLDIDWHAWGSDDEVHFTLTHSGSFDHSWVRTLGSSSTDRDETGSSGSYTLFVSGSGGTWGGLTIEGYTLKGIYKQNTSLHREAGTDGAGNLAADAGAIVDASHSSEYAVDEAEGSVKGVTPHAEAVSKGQDSVTVTIWGSGQSAGFLNVAYTDNFTLKTRRDDGPSGSTHTLALDANGTDGFTYYTSEGGGSPGDGTVHGDGSLQGRYRGQAYRIKARDSVGPGGATNEYRVELTGGEADAYRIGGTLLDEAATSLGRPPGTRFLLSSSAWGSSNLFLESSLGPSGATSRGSLDWDGSEALSLEIEGQTFGTAPGGGTLLACAGPPPSGLAPAPPPPGSPAPPAAQPSSPPLPPPPISFPKTGHPRIGPGVVPNAQQLLADLTVQAEIQLAWTRAQVNKEGKVHEEGGVIYMNPTTGAIFVARFTGDPVSADPEEGDTVDTVFVARDIPGYYIVGTFHTHPGIPGRAVPTTPPPRRRVSPASSSRKRAFDGMGLPSAGGGFTGDPSKWPPR